MGKTKERHGHDKKGEHKPTSYCRYYPDRYSSALALMETSGGRVSKEMGCGRVFGKRGCCRVFRWYKKRLDVIGSVNEEWKEGGRLLHLKKKHHASKSQQSIELAGSAKNKKDKNQ